MLLALFLFSIVSFHLFLVVYFSVQTKMGWRSLLTVWYSRQPLRIQVQSCPVLR